MSGDLRQRIFFEVHQGLYREGPGCAASTWQALACTGLDHAAPLSVLNLACGPGAQTLDLAARLAHARIVSVDLHAAYLADLRRYADAAGVSERVLPVRADMSQLPLADGAADLIWCEGAAYIMGVAAALDTWWSLLRPGGVIAFTEAVWLRDDPPEPVRTCWSEYPAMADVPACRRLLDARGYQRLDDFVLPQSAWQQYYEPMSRRLDAIEARYRDDPEAWPSIAECRAEIDVWRRYGDWYGYGFFIARRPPDATATGPGG